MAYDHKIWFIHKADGLSGIIQSVIPLYNQAGIILRSVMYISANPISKAEGVIPSASVRSGLGFVPRSAGSGSSGDGGGGPDRGRK